MEEALVALLLANVSVSALVDDRVHWLALPQGAQLPSIVLTVVTDIGQVTYQGINDLRDTRVQIDCYGESYSAAKTVARTVAGNLDGFKGVFSGVSFEGVFQDSEREGRDDDNLPDIIFRNSRDFRIWHKGV